MENVFVKYLTQQRAEPIEVSKEAGPVITISRDYGCGATDIACMMISSINRRLEQKGRRREWTVINKEMLERSAQELHSSPHLISHFFHAEEKGFYADIIESFSGKYYISDERIKKTFSRVIRNYAESGNVVLVGRAGFLLTRHIPRSLHVKLIAPLEWRTEKIAERMQISYQEARKKVNDMDQERNLFLNFFKYNPKDCDNFNLVFNRKDFSKHEIVEILLRIVEERKFY